MREITGEIAGLFLFERERFCDERGYFCEAFHQKKFSQAIGEEVAFLQDNISLSKRNVLRGLHYQKSRPQGKLVSALVGTLFDVAVDLRAHSKSYGKWHGEILSEENGRALFIPEGFAHGFLVLSDCAIVSYKATDYYDPSDQEAIIWNDPDLSIDWPIEGEPILSEKDRAAAPFSAAHPFLGSVQE